MTPAASEGNHLRLAGFRIRFPKLAPVCSVVGCEEQGTADIDQLLRIRSHCALTQIADVRCTQCLAPGVLKPRREACKKHRHGSSR